LIASKISFCFGSAYSNAIKVGTLGFAGGGLLVRALGGGGIMDFYYVVSLVVVIPKLS
jgi:hypothetical protein